MTRSGMARALTLLKKKKNQGSPGEWAMPRSVEEMLDGLRQRVDVPAPAGTAHNGLPQKKTGRGFPLNRRSGPLDDTAGQWTVLNRHRVASRDL